MKLSCTQENLATGLNMVHSIAAKGGTLPILQNVLLEASEGALKIKSTNLEIAITAHVRCKVEQEGTFTVNGRLFYEYVSLLSAEQVDISLEGEHLEVRAGNQQTKIHGLAAEEFPVIPSIETAHSYTLEVSDVKKALQRVLFAVAINEARPEISGVYFRFSQKNALIVGTDSYRLAEAAVELSAAVEEEKTFIVPLRTMQEVLRILSQLSGAVTISVSENQVLFSVEEAELISRLVVGTYPNYTQIIPRESKTSVVIDKEACARAIKSASLFCRQGLNHVQVQFSGDKILVSASASQVGENVVDVPAKIEGADADIVFDYRFLLDGLNAIDEDEVRITLSGAASPGIFSPKDPGYTYLVMPIKQ